MNNPKTLIFNEQVPIRAVSAHDNGGCSYAQEIRFFDAAMNEVYSYNPANTTQSSTVHELAENE